MTPAPCPSCGTTTFSAGFAQLWDGSEYCLDCIQAASPHLLPHAKDKDTLQETFRYSALKLAGIWAITFAVAWSSIWLVFPLIAIIGGKMDLLESLQAWAVISGIALPIIIVFSLAQAGGYALNRPTVSVAGGQLTVTQRGKSETVPLSECEWYLGKISHMNMLQNTVLLRNPALIIVLPPAEGKEACNVAVGVSDETRAIWQAFLNLTKTPQRTDWQIKQRISTTLKIGGLFLAVPIGFVAFMLIGRLVSEVLSLFIADQGLSLTVGTLVFVYGFVSAFLYAAITGPWHTNQPVPTKRTVKEQTKQRLVVLFGFMMANTVFAALPIAFYMDLSVLARIVGVALSYLWALSIGYDFGRRVSKYDREFAKPAESDA